MLEDIIKLGKQVLEVGLIVSILGSSPLYAIENEIKPVEPTTKQSSLSIPQTNQSEKHLKATQAGIVFPEQDLYFLFKAPYHMGQPNATLFDNGDGKPSLYTDNIQVCAGIEIRTDHSYSLIHGMGLGNTRELLNAITQQHKEVDVPLENVTIYVKTDNMPLKYENKIKAYFESKGIDVEISQIGYAPINGKLNRYSLRVDENHRR